MVKNAFFLVLEYAAEPFTYLYITSQSSNSLTFNFTNCHLYTSFAPFANIIL